jgi:hypothetical protein
MRYEIRIDGDTAEAVLRESFPELELLAEATYTVMSGPVIDEAQLYGVLVRFQELGLRVTEFRQLPD